MHTSGLLVVITILIALSFDFINGFHDAANSIATVVSTRVLSPRLAVVWAAFFNFVAAAIFGTAVAKTISSGLVDPSQVTQYVILAALAGAILWDLLTWWWGLPTSSSHALIGGLAGAAIARGGWHVLVREPKLHWPIIGAIPGLGAKWMATLIYIVLAPLISRALAMMVSRGRESLADASAAELTRNPLGLADALEKIDAAVAPTTAINRGSAHLCIADPLGRQVNREEGFWSDLFASHPPMRQRIAALRAMAFQH